MLKLSPTPKWVVPFLFFFALVLYPAYVFFVKDQIVENDEPKWISTARQAPLIVETIPSEMELLWEKENTLTDNTIGGKLLMIAVNNSAYLIGSFDVTDFQTVYKIDLRSGDIVWQLPNDQGIFEPKASTLANNAKTIFIGFDGTQKIDGSMSMGAGKIVAYDADSSNEVWSQPVPGARSISTLVASPDWVTVDGNYSSQFHIFDAKSGVALSSSKMELLLFKHHNSLFKRVGPSIIIAEDAETGGMLWDHTSGNVILDAPLLIDEKNMIIFRTGDEFGTVYALNMNTGEQIWRHGNVMSNVAVSDSVAYFVTTEAQLSARDIASGDILASVAFQPAENLESNLAFPIGVAASQNVVLVYFGGSRQMFGFYHQATGATFN